MKENSRNPHRPLSNILIPSFSSKLPAIMVMEKIKSTTRKRANQTETTATFFNNMPFLTTSKDKIKKEKKIYRVKRKEKTNDTLHTQGKYSDNYISNNSEGSILLYPEDIYEEKLMNDKITHKINNNINNKGFLPFTEILKNNERKILFVDEARNLNTMIDNIDFNRTQKEGFNKMLFQLREISYKTLYKTIKDDEKIINIENSRKKIKNKEKNNKDNNISLKNKVSRFLCAFKIT
jgi:hypothetical protein